MSERMIAAAGLSFSALSDIAYSTLKEAIDSRKLLPGERLVERELAEEIGVSRTPLREAMHRLEADGYIAIVPRKGSYVTEINLKDVISLFEIRASLEVLAAEKIVLEAKDEEIEILAQLLNLETEYWKARDFLKTVEADHDFHAHLFKFAHNPYLESIMQDLNKKIQRYRAFSPDAPVRGERTLREHSAILQALRARDREEAARATRTHIESALHVITKLAAKSGE